MEEQAEFKPAVVEVESEAAELIVPANPEADSEVSESASRAAAMIALNETAARNDWPQDRVDSAIAGLETQFASEVTTSGLVGAIEAAHEEAQTEERSGVTYAYAEDRARERAELLNLQDTAAHKGWSDERYQEAEKAVKAKYRA